MNYKVSDNHVLDFPARMSDGRQFTDYRQNCIMNNNVAMKNSSWLLRQELINNAENYMDNFQKIEENNNKCTTCRDNTVLNIQNYQQCSPTGCTYKSYDPKGLGIGRLF